MESLAEKLLAVNAKQNTQDWTPRNVNQSHAKLPTMQLPGDHMSMEERLKIHAEYETKRNQEAAIRKQGRLAEGGRAGGFNDKNAPLDPKLRARDDEDGFDDFGRRISGRKKDANKNERAQAALQRLKQKFTQRSEAGSSSSEAGRRDGSRSPRERGHSH